MRARRRTVRAARAVVLTLALAATACTGQQGAERDVGLPDHLASYVRNANIDPGRIHIQPASAPAGGFVDAAFPQGDDRGQALVVQRREGNRWTWAWLTVSDPASPAEASSWPPSPVAAGDVDWGDIGIVGTGPQRIPIPQDASAGTYRACLDLQATAYCAGFEVVDE